MALDIARLSANRLNPFYYAKQTYPIHPTAAPAAALRPTQALRLQPKRHKQPFP